MSESYETRNVVVSACGYRDKAGRVMHTVELKLGNLGPFVRPANDLTEAAMIRSEVMDFISSTTMGEGWQSVPTEDQIGQRRLPTWPGVNVGKLEPEQKPIENPAEHFRGTFRSMATVFALGELWGHAGHGASWGHMLLSAVASWVVISESLRLLVIWLDRKRKKDTNKGGLDGIQRQ